MVITPRLKKFSFFLLQVAISGAALVYACHGASAAGIAEAFFGYPWWYFPLALAALLVNYLASGVRLYILFKKDAGFLLATRAAVVGIGYNGILPAKGGDILKLLFLSRHGGYTMGKSGALIVWERFFDFFILAMLSCYLFTTGKTEMSFIPLLLLIVLMLSGVYILRKYSSFFYSLYKRIPFIKIKRFLQNAHAEGVDGISMSRLGQCVFISICIWGCYFLFFYFSISIGVSAQLTLSQLLTVFAVCCLGAAIPSSPGGVGIFEAAMVLSLSWYGVDGSSALCVALVMHALVVVPAAIGAICIFSGQRGGGT